MSPSISGTAALCPRIEELNRMALLLRSTRLSSRSLALALLSTTAGLGATALLAEVPGKQPARAGSAPPKSAKAVTPSVRSAIPTAVKAGPVMLTGTWQKSYDLIAGKVVEISVHLDKPSALPANGRVAVEWKREGETTPAEVKRLDISGAPTSNWRKVLHALDNDTYVFYRAPVTGRYTLTLHTVVDEEPVGTVAARWREKGNAPLLAALPAQTPWPAGTAAPVSVTVRPVAIGDQAEQDRLRTYIECKPDASPEQAQTVTLNADEEGRAWEVTGSADDIEYFDNGRVGQAGDNWFRLEYKGTEPRLLTAQLSLPNQTVAARVRCYTLDPKQPAPAAPHTAWKPGDPLLPVLEYEEGFEENERVHQQDEKHRTNISRTLRPGGVYFLRVEANAPGYQLQMRVVKPAPYTDPRQALRQGIYTQIGQVDAWLTNRPRGASVERRLRDSGNLLGTQCMSCHTQSGVWGPAVPFTLGYRPENIQNYWHLTNVMYECLRPTNTIKDAANNTSLPPLDFGDGPAGTRAAGFNIVNAEKFLAPSKLHAKQQFRTANYMLASSDPGGINAAGPGSNVGEVVVYLMATEILKTAWEKTGDPKFFRALEARLHKTLEAKPKYTDDVAIRMDIFGRVIPIDAYAAMTEKAGAQEKAAGLPVKTDATAVTKFVEQVKTQLTEDEARLRAVQNADGSWSFNPGKVGEDGKRWKAADAKADPSPTALAITALTSLGAKKEDPAVAKGVAALLSMQKPAGRWNKAALTGFVSTAYALHALARLYPTTAPALRRADYTPKPNETLLQTLHRVQALALTGEPKFVDLLLQAARHDSPVVREWAMIGLGATHTAQGAPALIAALADHAKPVREAAVWALRQTLLDDNGWDAALNAAEQGNDDTRAAVAEALNMRADAVLTGARVNWNRLNFLFDRGLNRDPHPAVRAWTAKAAWQWWVWNPPVRAAINAAWVTLLSRPEPNSLVENSVRYSSQALFIANGHKANGSSEQQYKELATLFTALTAKLEAPDGDLEAKRRLVARLIGIGATYYATSGSDGGPGQMGYATPGSGEMMGKAALAYLAAAEKRADLTALRVGLEGAANVPYQPLTDYLVNYSLRGPDELRQLASSAVSDPRSVSLAAVPELVEPQLAQVMRGAMEPPRRVQISDPILNLWSRVNWIIPKTTEQQRNFFSLIIPRLDAYYTPEQLNAITDPARRSEVEKTQEANHYLADRLGDVLKENPDLHQRIVLTTYFPEKFTNPLQELYWLRNVEWILTFSTDDKPAPAPAIKAVVFQQPTPSQPQQPDPLLTVKDRALQLYLDSLRPTADPKAQEVAIRMANKTALRSNPEVIRALAELAKTEKNPELKTILANVLKQSSEFLPNLNAELKKERHSSIAFNAAGEPVLTKAQTDDVLYFRDYVLPELTRQKRSDQQACMGCHGLPGRVPSLYLRAPDKFGFMPVADVLYNYRTLQQRVNLTDIERSKLLRKPLNIQDGKEDGHQGGRRYAPGDPGYLLLRHWVESQAEVQKAAR
jgi:hypothetical protein